jgi:diguanylate cyclase (GGDEF)-like protein
MIMLLSQNMVFFLGVVSISRLLMKFAEVQTQIASYLNPLTGLPGNLLIDEQLNDLLEKEAFTVLYIDIDYFKTYNDIYGFTKGDQVIKATASLLQGILKEAKGFLGHIGGDDFLVILYHYDYEKCCHSIIQKFDQLLPTFYSQEHLEQKFVFSEDRSGIERKIPLLSLSISVVTNQERTFFQKDEIVSQATEIKRICKSTPGSCYLDYSHISTLC